MSVISFFRKTKLYSFLVLLDQRNHILKRLFDLSYFFKIRHSQKKYRKVKEELLKKDKIRVAFYVLFDSQFSGKPLFDRMLLDEQFAPFIVIIPHTQRGQHNMLSQTEKSYKSLVALYPNEQILTGYDKEKKQYKDYSDYFDIFIFSNPYERATHTYHRLSNHINKNSLIYYIHYAFFSSLKIKKAEVKMPIFNLFTKVFVSTEHSLNYFKKYQWIKAKNVVLSGYCKLDDLYSTVSHESKELSSNQRGLKDTQKSIIIALHHSVGDRHKNATFSNFYKYHEFFLDLPKKYPNIDFIFRPHPLLFINLENDKSWGKDKLENYLKNITSHQNVTISIAGAYYDLFTNSDAMIHDCCSFIEEYLATGKPCCYMIKNQKTLETLFNKFGLECLNLYHKAFRESDIINFIENVVLKGRDELMADREIYAIKYLLINHPRVSDYIFNEIKSDIM
jgi:hypothetical protein